MKHVIAVLPYLIGAFLVAVLLTLFVGLGGMAGGGEFNRRHANKIMRLRVALQAATIALFILYVLLTRF
ncbi:MAG: twin transmembrane helix small protein [Pseudomonadota bacterium]